MIKLDRLHDRIGELNVRALQAGGEPLLDRVMIKMGAALRHSDRIAAGVLTATPGVLEEMKRSIDAAELDLHDQIERLRTEQANA